MEEYPSLQCSQEYKEGLERLDFLLSRTQTGMKMEMQVLLSLDKL